MNIGSIKQCLQFNFMTRRKDYKVFCIILLTFGYLCMVSQPILEFCRAKQVYCGPWLFVFLMSHKATVLYLMICYILFICDIPATSQTEYNIFIRAGRKNWAVGQILFLFCSTLLYWVSIYGLSLLSLFPRIEWGTRWGAVLTTLARNPAMAPGNSIWINPAILLDLSPIPALLFCFTLCVGVSFLLGLFIFYFNTTRFTKIGIILASFFVFVQHFVSQTSGYYAFRLSPVSWTSLSIVNTTDRITHMPSLQYAWGAILLGSFVMLFVILRRAFRKNSEIIR